MVLHTVTEYRRKEDNGEQSLLLRIKGGRVHSIPYNDDNEAEQQIAQTTSNLRIPGDEEHKKQQTAALLRWEEMKKVDGGEERHAGNLFVKGK